MDKNLSTGIEIRNRGIISICGKIEDDSMATVIKELIFMNSIEKPIFKAIQMILNSSGGSIRAGFMITDFIEFSKLPVYITGLGICGSMGMLILCSGEKGHRVITKNTSLLSHQYSWENKGKYHELIANRKEQNLIQQRMISHYLKHTHLNEQQICDILLPNQDVWLTDKEAKKYGLVDKVI